MKTDRELLELAAKAAGIPTAFCGPDRDTCRRTDTWELWNPLTDDGDALRLACDLDIRVYPVASTGAGDTRFATRRAIVSAAASTGERL